MAEERRWEKRDRVPPMVNGRRSFPAKDTWRPVASDGVEAWPGHELETLRGQRRDHDLGDGEVSPEDKLEMLRRILRDCGSLVVAYSGGVDSAFLMYVAHEALGDRALAVTAQSPSLPSSELDEARALAERFGWPHRVIETREVEDPNYAANSPSRCFFCKTELYNRLRSYLDEGWGAIANGTNADDTGDFRPGIDAAKRFDVRSPLLEAGLTKSEIRTLSREAGLPTWDKPAQACLSSRVPYGTRVTVEVLGQIEAAEAALRDHGFRGFRVRHHGNLARIEVPPEDMPKIIAPDTREAIVERLRELGYVYVSIDLAGFRSGSMNEAMRPRRGQPEPAV